MDKTVVEIKKIKNKKVTVENDTVICEYPLTIIVNKEEIITLLCTPKNLKELAYGYLFSEGFISTKEDVFDIYVNQSKGVVRVNLNNEIDLTKKLSGKRAKTTGCGNNTILYHPIDSIKLREIVSDFKIHYQKIIELSKDLNNKSTLFLETGGVHSSMLTNSESILTFCEDVGRHNTIDKIIGDAILNNLDLSKTVLFTSGRISSEMLLKTLKAKIPIIISRSAPTDLAVKIAENFNVALIGFVRGERMNIYHDAKRIIY